MYLFIYIPILGKPTRLAPIPKPAPDLAETASDGTYVSSDRECCGSC